MRFCTIGLVTWFATWYTAEVLHGQTQNPRTTSSAEVRVIDTCVGPVFIPNAVSPNGDGMNDRWKPVWWAERITSYELRVFDRWGHELFFSMDPDTAWEANDVPVGVYAYQLHAIEEGSAAAYEAVGHVTVVR